MASSPTGTDDYTHQLAIKLSRVLNIVNPNDLLARTVIDLAKSHPFEGFAKGAAYIFFFVLFLMIFWSLLAARAFGKFQDSFLAELHSEILSHEKREASGAPLTVAGITVHDSDVLEPEPARQGGLFQSEKVSHEGPLLMV
jgi:pre-mRNA-splicing factor ATP-dependent RNA helicase DHX38/PRP16